MQRKIKHVVVVGGGTAGWITAGIIAAEHGNAGIQVSLVESPDIPIIGVGEGTWPSMRMTLKKIGLSEKDLIRVSEASFKQGTKFIGWSDNDSRSTYYHPFSLPLEYTSLNLASYWLTDKTNEPFADYVTPQAAVISAGKAPKQISTPEYAFNVNYGYHFDAGKFAQLLHQHVVTNLGVNYVSANVQEVKSLDNGDIASLSLSTGQNISGDLFIDCTGQKSLLLGQHYGVEFVAADQVLFNNRAIAVQVPYADPAGAINSATHATAQESGWVWDIGLQTRRGVGYVHCDAYVSEEQAVETLLRYIQTISPETNTAELMPRTINFAPGFRRQFWKQNCVAVGLSAGFIEPLEASALALIEQSATLLSQQLPADREIMDSVARRFNDKLAYHWSKIIEFLKLHYAVTKRDDSEYWRANTAPSSWPDSLNDKIKMWQQQAPWHDDAPRVDELFPSASYQYVLYGMDFKPKYESGFGMPQSRDAVHRMVHSMQQKAGQMVAALPSNRELVTEICAH